jgi:hypothetical protein
MLGKNLRAPVQDKASTTENTENTEDTKQEGGGVLSRKKPGP